MGVGGGEPCLCTSEKHLLRVRGRPGWEAAPAFSGMCLLPGLYWARSPLTLSAGGRLLGKGAPSLGGALLSAFLRRLGVSLPPTLPGAAGDPRAIQGSHRHCILVSYQPHGGGGRSR